VTIRVDSAVQQVPVIITTDLRKYRWHADSFCGQLYGVASEDPPSTSVDSLVAHSIVDSVFYAWEPGFFTNGGSIGQPADVRIVWHGTITRYRHDGGTESSTLSGVPRYLLQRPDSLVYDGNEHPYSWDVSVRQLGATPAYGGAGWCPQPTQNESSHPRFNMTTY
jgi:hypothetical protein